MHVFANPARFLRFARRLTPLLLVSGGLVAGAALAWGLDRGEPLRARITRLEPHPNPARRVRFEVYVE